MSARRDLRSSAQQLPVRTSEQLKASFRSSEHGSEVLSESEQIAAELLDAAFTAARLTDKEVAHLCNCSESLVQKWRSKTARGGPSFTQMLMLPPSFHIALHRAMNKKFGLARAALVDLLDAAGSLAVLVP